MPESGQLKRLAISLPLDELWTSEWPVEALRDQQVGAERIKEILVQGMLSLFKPEGEGDQ